jgi:hypothetical protein
MTAKDSMISSLNSLLLSKDDQIESLESEKDQLQMWLEFLVKWAMPSLSEFMEILWNGSTARATR